MLRRSPYFADCLYSEFQVETASSLIAGAATEAANRGWIGHPDDYLPDAERAVSEVGARIYVLVDAAR